MGEKDMGKKKQKVLYDADGARRVMRKRDYMADYGRPVSDRRDGQSGWPAYLLLYR